MCNDIMIIVFILSYGVVGVLLVIMWKLIVCKIEKKKEINLLLYYIVFNLILYNYGFMDL